MKILSGSLGTGSLSFGNDYLSHISLSQFYGIEIDDFAGEIAKLALWLAEHQMNVEFFKEFGRTNPTLPLKEAGKIVQGNAGRSLPEELLRRLLDSFGLSRSSISRDFKEKSTRKLKEFENRSLQGHEYVALFIDGKYLAKEQIVIVLGVTLTGEKIPLGFIQTHTENAESIKALLTNLVERGLNYDDGLLCIIDGAKGIRNALVEVFGCKIVIQRCQWHKHENVLSYLNERDQVYFRKKLNRAYRSDNYNEAKEQLLNLRDELKVRNLSAARSLEEGLEATLTLHRLGLAELFGKSFSTTNCIENLNSQLGKYIGKVKCWKTSDQRYRWVASALLEVEQRKRKVDNSMQK